MSFFNVLPKDKKRPVSKIKPEPIVLEKEAVKEIQVTVGEGVTKASYGEEIKKSPSPELELFEADEQQETYQEDQENEIIVPNAFMDWYNNVDKSIKVFKAFNLIEKENNPRLTEWVEDNQDEFAKIWLGQLVPVVEIPLYVTTIPNYGKNPNALVKTEEGLVVMKPFGAIEPTDTWNLTEEEIREDWAYLFENGYSEFAE